MAFLFPSHLPLPLQSISITPIYHFLYIDSSTQNGHGYGKQRHVWRVRHVRHGPFLIFFLVNVHGHGLC